MRGTDHHIDNITYRGHCYLSNNLFPSLTIQVLTQFHFVSQMAMGCHLKSSPDRENDTVIVDKCLSGYIKDHYNFQAAK